MDKTYKVIVVGDPSVGKGELIAKLETNQLDESIPTIGVSILRRSIELREFNVTVNLMLWDVAGQPPFYKLHRPYFNGADGMVLVFDLTRSSSFSNINNWYSIAVKYGLSGIPRILIGNKAHLKGQTKIILPMAEHLSKKLNAHYYETSSLTGENIKEAFEKIAELIYRAKELDEHEKDEELTIKPYQGESIEVPDKNHSSPFTSQLYEPYSVYGPFGSSAASALSGPPNIESSKFSELILSISNDNNRLEKPLDWESKLILLKEIQPSSSESDSTEKEDYTTHAIPSLKRENLSQSIEIDKREKRALKTTFRYFNESKVVYFKPDKSQAELLSAIETGDLVVLTGKSKIQTVMEFLIGFVFISIFESFFGLVFISIFELNEIGERIVPIVMIINLIGVSGWLIIFAIYLRHYFIVLDSQGIHYKKIGKPRFISWNDMVRIFSYQRRFLSMGKPIGRVIRIYLISKKEVQFKENNYRFKPKFFEFDDVFRMFKFRRCPFFRYGR